jgi:Nucleotidyltransferase
MRQRIESALWVQEQVRALRRLNELGAVGVAARIQDIDLARCHRLALAAPLSLLHVLAATRLDFVPVPGMGNAAPSTSVKRPGRDGLRVDLLTPGKTLGQPVPISELQWHAQTVPRCDYLLKEPRRVAPLAGGHCVPVMAPAP